MARWPTVPRPRRGTRGRRRRAWAGLGYNRRAVSLHRAAKEIVQQHGGEVPSSVAALEALPGVGRTPGGPWRRSRSDCRWAPSTSTCGGSWAGSPPASRRPSRRPRCRRWPTRSYPADRPGRLDACPDGPRRAPVPSRRSRAARTARPPPGAGTRRGPPAAVAGRRGPGWRRQPAPPLPSRRWLRGRVLERARRRRTGVGGLREGIGYARCRAPSARRSWRWRPTGCSRPRGRARPRRRLPRLTAGHDARSRARPRALRPPPGGAPHPALLRELRAGRKTGHWIWYVFPQLAGLGRSELSRFYGIAFAGRGPGLPRAPGAGSAPPRVRLGARWRTGTARQMSILGPVDAMKVRSSMTLFHRADPASRCSRGSWPRTTAALPDPRTDELLRLRTASGPGCHPARTVPLAAVPFPAPTAPARRRSDARHAHARRAGAALGRRPPRGPRSPPRR